MEDILEGLKYMFALNKHVRYDDVTVTFYCKPAPKTKYEIELEEIDREFQFMRKLEVMRRQTERIRQIEETKFFKCPGI